MRDSKKVVGSKKKKKKWWAQRIVKSEYERGRTGERVGSGQRMRY